MGMLADRVTAKRRVRASDAVVELPEVCCAAPESSEPAPRDAVLDPSDDRVRLWNRFAMMAEKDERLATLYMWLKEAFCSQRWQDSPFRVLHVDMLKTEGDTLYVRFNIYSETRVYHIQAHLRPKDAYDDYLGATYTTRKDDPGEDWNRGADLSDGEFSRETFNKIVGDFLSLEILPHLDPNVYPAGASNAPSFYHELYIDEGKKGIVPIVEKSKNGIVEVLAKKKIEELKHGLTRDGKRYGVSIGKDKDGYFCYTHRARSKSYPTIADIPKSALNLIDSTAMKKVEGKAEVYLGESGLDKSWQAEFPADAKCCRCGGDARIAFVMQETPDSDGPSIADLHERNREGNGGLWLHDAGSFATYLCEKCLEPTTLYNQAMKADAKKDTVASALEFLMSMPLYERDRNEGATVAEKIASSKHGLGPESHRIYDALCLLFVDKNAGLMFGDMPISDALDKLKEMGYDGVTRRKTEGHEPLTAAKSKTLHIWDFDGTLIDTGEFHQDRIDNPKPIKKNLDRFKSQIADDADVVVMTARSNAGLVRRTLEDAGVDMTGIRIIALGTTKNEAKGEYIAKNFASKYATITLYDDRKAYLESAEEAMEDKDANFKTVHADKVDINKANVRRYKSLLSADNTGKQTIDSVVNEALDRYWGVLERELSSLLPGITASLRATGSATLESKSDPRNPVTGEPGKTVYLHINNGGVSFWVGEHKFVDQETGDTLIFQPTIEMRAGHFGNVTNMMSILANPQILHDLAAYFEDCATQWDDVYVADDQLMDGPTEARVETVQASKHTGWRRIADVRKGESVYHRGAFVMAQSDWELLGMTGTDSGLLAVTDPAYVVKKNSGERAVDEAVTDWDELLDKNDSFKKPASVPFAAGHDGLMLVTPTGGESDYEVWGHYEDGELTEIKIPIRKVEKKKEATMKTDAATTKKYQVTYQDGSIEFKMMTASFADQVAKREGVVAVEPIEEVDKIEAAKGEYDLWGSIEKAVERGLLTYIGFMAADYLHKKKASVDTEAYEAVVGAFDAEHDNDLTDDEKAVIRSRLNEAGWDATEEGICYLWDELRKSKGKDSF